MHTRKYEKIPATFKCGHVKAVHYGPILQHASERDCPDCMKAALDARIATEGHQHKCFACPGEEVVVSGCKCDSADIRLLCDFCKGEDARSRKQLHLR